MKFSEPIKSMLDEHGELLAYAWPGGYPMFYLDKENSVLCVACANSEVNSCFDEEGESIGTNVPAFLSVAHDINYEDESLFCDQCSEQIEAAYAEREEYV